MSLIHQYILEFNKLVSSINFMSSANDVAIKNKLFLIQQNITEDVDFNSFESYNFISNIYNILNQTSDNKSPVVANCIDLLQTSINSRNKSIMKIIQDINFLPATTKLLWFVNDCCDSLIKLLTLIKNIIRFNYQLDEHNLKIFVESLRDLVENFSDKRVAKLSMHILVNLAMHNDSAKYLISRSIKLTDVENKLDKSNDLISTKFYIIVMEEFDPKDIVRLLKLSLKSIKEALPIFDTEPIVHSLDIFKYAKKMCHREVNLSEMEELMGILEELNGKLIIHFSNDASSELKREFIENIFHFYSQLLDFDNNLAHHFTKFVQNIFDCAHYTRSACGLKFLSNFITYKGSFDSMDKTVGSVIDYFINNCDVNPKIIGNSEKYEFLKFLKVLHQNDKLESTYFKSVLEYMENILSVYDNMMTENIEDDTILLLTYSLQTLNVLSQDSNLFKDLLDKLLDLNIVPYIIAKAYSLKNEEILMVLFSLTSMEKFPKSKVAELLSKNVYSNHDQVSYKEVKSRSESKFTSKYITRHLLDDLDGLIKRINQKLDNNDCNGLKASDVISLYRQKNNYLQDHLTTVSDSLNTYADLYNKAQQQNCILRRLGDKQEVVNWSLQLDMENITKVNHKLESENSRLERTITSLRNKIEKESTQVLQLSKQITIKNKEIEKFRSEKAAMESEKQKFRQAQKENEIRIQQLKQSLEEEKKSRESEVTSALAEQKRIAQNAEKEQAKLQEVIKLNENDIIQKQKRISELETELKEAEKIQTSILSLMQKSKRT
ncbi:nuclease SbcCD subunit C-like [Chironomus tepperi]|uniref:nuclease SbcCD subunit C-like n=1 Tax=Chironomus tepperi TaxID=113505 RepID=UPI00391EFC3A